MFNLFLHIIIIKHNCFYFLADNAYVANSTIKNKSINLESHEENIVNFNKSMISKLYLSK